MTAVLEGTALVVAAGGVLVGVLVAARAGLRAGVPVLLDFLLAAGLLRLSVAPSWDAIAVTALVVAIRHLLTAGLAARPVTPR